MKHDFSELRLDAVSRRFDHPSGEHVYALKELSLTVPRGQFVALLGPSGCGKTTALNCIAGLLPLSGGGIWLDQLRIDGLPPEKRGFGMVFQNYAIFPHLNVFENIAFPLRARRWPKAAIAERVAWALDLVRLGRFADRYARQQR